MSVYRFLGRVVEHSTRRSLPGIRVEAWDAENRATDLVAFAITDARGEFTVSLDDAYLAEIFQDQSPTIAFRVFATSGEAVVSLVTEYALWKLEAPTTHGTIEARTSGRMGTATPAPSVVRGNLVTAEGNPIPSTTVEVYDQGVDTKEETLLGTAQTDTAGYYRVAYTLSTGAAGRPAPNLVVRAIDGAGAILVESQRICHAPAAATINLVVGGRLRGPSEIDALTSRIAAHQGRLTLPTALADELERLACAAGADPARVSALGTAHALAAETGVSATVHYALLREGLPATRRELLLMPQRDLRRALEAAIDKNTVPASLAANLDTVMGELRAAAIDAAFIVPSGATGCVGDLVATVLGASPARTFLDNYLSHDGAIEDFWAGLGAQMTGVTAGDIADLQLAFQLGALTRLHFPLVQELQRRKGGGQFGSLRDLAKYSEADWLDVLGTVQNGQAIGFPAGTPGENALGEPDTDIQKANYAKVLRRTLEQSFPTASIAGDIMRATSASDPVYLFLDTQTEFELGVTRVAGYLAERSLTLPSDALTRLKHIERLHKLTPRYTEMEVLLADGVHSAREVVRMGESAFLTKYAPAFGLEVAKDIVARAGRTAAHALALHVKHAPSMHQLGIRALPDFLTQSSNATDAPQQADWTTLFGSPDFCDCAHCNSVYGPAAYLVDLLQFLGSTDTNVQQGNTNLTARDVLFQKRPDLGKIDLTCDNTLVPIPYVDLVNEILEHAVANKLPPPAPPATTAYPSHLATTGSPEDLRALPAIVPGEETARSLAYGALASAEYPWSLPFNLATTEARVYLQHLGVPRDELMRTLQRPDPNQNGALVPSALEIAAERLGLSSEELVVISGGSAASIQALWGLPAGTNLQQELVKVPVFLAQSGLDYEEFAALLDTSFMDGLGAPMISPVDACSPSDMTLAWTDPNQMDAAFRAVHRFVRLQRRIGYSIRELDQALTAWNGVIDIEGLAAVERLRARFNLPVAVASSWFGPLDTRARERGQVPSYYEQIFQNKAVGVWDAEDSLGVAAITAAPSSITATLAQREDALRAALRISAADFALLTDPGVAAAQIGESTALLQNANLTLANLSALHRIVTFARALELPLRDFLVLDKLSGKALTTGGQAGVIPFDPAAAEAFVQMVDRVRRSGFEPAELLFLFSGVEAPQTLLSQPDDVINQLLETLFAGLVKIHDKQAALTDPEGEMVGKMLGDLVAVAAERDKIVGVISGDLLDSTHSTLPGNGGEDADAYFDLAMAPLFWAPAVVKAGLVGASALSDKADRYALAYQHLSIQVECQRLIQQTLGASAKLDAATARALLCSILTVGGSKLIDAFALPAPVPEQWAPTQAQRDAYRRLSAAAIIIDRFRLTADEVTTYFAPAPAAALFDVNALPPGPTTPDAALFAEWQTLVDLVELRASSGAGLLSVFEGGSAEGPQNASKILGWSLPDIQRLLHPTNGLGISFSGNAATGAALLRLRDAFAALKRLGVSADTAFGWVAPVGTIDSASIIQTAKSKHSEADWATVAPPLRDAIREKQRDTLVDFLLVMGPYTDKDHLFGALYVDVEMAPCQLTSRIKQAIGSVQTFVQRALLHLEPDVMLSELAARQWTWRKSYRVWEANRKIFLYPENWIYPELRDDKSAFFKALERELRQKDITDDVAEDAFARYLEKLSEVAKLDVVATCHEYSVADSGETLVDVLHVIGRTDAEPSKYFYRTRVDGAYWTPWEPMDLDIEGDHLLLEVSARRLHLFWPVLAEKPDGRQKIPSKDKKGTEPTKRLEIRMAWSEYHNKKWSPRRVSKGDAVTVGPVVNSKWLTFVFQGPSIAVLLNPHKWLIDHAGLVRLGSFSFNACTGQMQGKDLKRRLPDPNELHRAVEQSQALREEATEILDQDSLDPLTAFVEVSKAVLDQLAALTLDAKAKVIVDAFLENTDHEVSLTMPVLSTRVFQDDKQLPIAEAQQFPSAAQDMYRLDLPVVAGSAAPGTVVLGATPSRFRLTTAHRIGNNDKDMVGELEWFFYKDASRTYFVEMEIETRTVHTIGSKVPPGITTLVSNHGGAGDVRLGRGSTLASWAASAPNEAEFAHTEITKGYRFWSHYHPHACNFLSMLHAGGVPGLLQWPMDPAVKHIQFWSYDTFQSQYQPSASVVRTPHPVENVDFSFGGAYSLYNWEVFFHIPFLVATRLTQNQRFDEAQKWFHYIFDPTSGGTGKTPQRFWKVKPFFENHDLATIQEELVLLAQSQIQVGDLSDGAKGMKSLLELGESIEQWQLMAQIEAWEKNPFNPHVIARLRPLAYQKAVVMKYVENLVAWGDQLFRRDTIESINEATQLYILANQLLGPRPVRVRPPAGPPVRTYDEIAAQGMGAFSDPLVEAEALVFQKPGPMFQIVGSGTRFEPPPDLRALLFCVPPDEMLLGLWDTVADRLFKLRHCMNIEGVVRQLPLFEPPIDPALLVRATAAGVDIASALDDTGPLLSNYRFSVMHAKAMELASSVTALGGAFLAALEKKDAESLSRLRSGHEIDLLTAVRELKQEQIREARENLQGLEKALETATIRRDYYAGLPKVSAGEQHALEMSRSASARAEVAQGVSMAASSAHRIPDVAVGVAGITSSPLNAVYVGGHMVGAALEGIASALSAGAAREREEAAATAVLAGYERRWEEWKHQVQIAKKEIQQIGKQIAAAEIRLAVAEKDLDNHDLQIQHAREVGDYLRDKLTSEELYDWMIEDLSTVYFESYKLAYDVAKGAEKAYRFERAVDSSSYITFGYWDSLKKGLLAGEKLVHDLRRLEVAYLEQNAREYEITKHVSLSALAPAELVKLRETGTCAFTIGEEQFDYDFPGHFLRRLKSVSLTIPTVTGAYGSVNATLTLEGSDVRTKPSLRQGSVKYKKSGADDDRFSRQYVAVTARIATSNAQNDAGMFDPNLRDERYLPFEGAGAVNSAWKLSLPPATNGFDVATTSDVVLHLRYTARDGGAKLASEAIAEVVKPTSLPARQRLISARAEFPEAWERFINPPAGATEQALVLSVDASMFPYLSGELGMTVQKLTVYARWRQSAPFHTDAIAKMPPQACVSGQGITNPTKQSPDLVPSSPSNTAKWEVLPGANTKPGEWVVSILSSDIPSYLRRKAADNSDVTPYRLDDTLQDVWLLVEYTQAVG